MSWKSKKREKVSRSAPEADSEAWLLVLLRSITWLLGLYKELGVSVNLHVHMMHDNKATIQIAANLIFHEITKHRDIDCHFIRENLSRIVENQTHQLANY